jgi:hypothetical protein
VKGQPRKSRRRIALVAAIALGLAGWLVLRARPAAEPEVQTAEQEEAAPTPVPIAPPAAEPPPPPSKAAPTLTATAPRPLEYMSDGVPIMPAGPNDPHPNTFVHPHPITPKHIRIFEENALLFQLNEAMDGQEVPRLRSLLTQYRLQYPEDPHEMQAGYTLIADCIEHPNEETRAAAQRYYDTETASTLRRFVMRHCLTDNR